MKKIVLYVITAISILSSITLANGQVYAHDALLDVEYDNCIYDIDEDGINEMWYKLDKYSSLSHLDNETTTIRYYCSVYLENEDTHNIPIDDIIKAYTDSMKKWNNVYFYAYNQTGDLVKKKLINIEEGTATDHNLEIFFVDNISAIAITNCTNKVALEAGHYHSNNWNMRVNVNHFYVHGNDYTAEYVECVRERNGAHEFGHVLGLTDLEYDCLAQTTDQHHYELMMGYGSTLVNRAREISYKDIAGVAITRGFHTDDDHEWLYKEMEDGKYKMLCSVCNGVKWIDSFNGYTYGIDYYLYGQCSGLHDLSNGNMMAVASYGDQDYYKCKYCRYVAPFENLVDQDYCATYVDNLSHQCINNVPGLEYTFMEPHKIDRYLYYNNSSHRGVCSCGRFFIEAHYVIREEIKNNRYAMCHGCSTPLDLISDSATLLSIIADMRTANGSYILPNGIVVLVEADLEAYENSTLQFYNINGHTQTE